ncbi:cobalamin B12-binding domain-containing protein [Dehalobacterium formicoaceticum]|uniref:Corrinoid protein n=1 Tax=Dehalobacterium formicoaceticum TaxID=51515 RepID=A0ABT1Y765_9FIRM|nr:corrinoid protein [Dehalobacterium formicoaceticum]MCR6546316.1 corrinoid protein [Dehalobacterium formicoaceticum]
MSKEQIIQEAIESILKINNDKAVQLAEQTLSEGLNPVEVLTKGFSVGIKQVGDLFGRGEMFLPELMLAAGVMQTVTKIFDDALQGKSSEKIGKMVFATVEGDVHDIGKGIVISLVKTQGIEIIDLGRDVPVSRIIEVAVKENADLIGTSALLTTTMVEQKKLEDELKKNSLKGKIMTMVGGAPVTQRWADRIGADAYGEDASEAVNKALELLSTK